MRIKYSDIISANATLKKLMSNDQPAVTPLAALRLARAGRVIAAEIDAFNAAQLALLKELVPETDTDGNRIIPPDRISEYTERINAITAEEIEVDVQPIALADFGNAEVGLTALIGMDWLIDDSPPPAKRKR